jgi:hypothetical protein
VAAVFGSAFLIALLSVPVTTTTARLHQDQGSNIVFKTTYPRNTTMFLPRYLSARARSAENGAIRLRSAQWTGTMAVIIVFLLLSNMPVDFFKAIKPYLFTSYLNVWQKILEEPIPWRAIRNDLLIIGGHCVGFYIVTWYIFVKKDILS